jgi:hypothetical protein
MTRNVSISLALLAALALASCSTSTRGPSVTGRPLPDVVPTLSLAGNDSSGCAPPRFSRERGPGFEIARAYELEIDAERAARAEAIGGVGHPIVHYFGCRRFVIELTVLIDGNNREADILRAYQLLAVFMPDSPTRDPFRSLADAMRLDGPYVFGWQMQLSQDQSLSVRFDPTRTDARLMVVFRMGL